MDFQRPLPVGPAGVVVFMDTVLAPDHQGSRLIAHSRCG
jgi:hypothetical protein